MRPMFHPISEKTEARRLHLILICGIRYFLAMIRIIHVLAVSHSTKRENVLPAIGPRLASFVEIKNISFEE